MRVFFGYLFAFAIAAAVGLGATWLSLSRGVAFGALNIGEAFMSEDAICLRTDTGAVSIVSGLSKKVGREQIVTHLRKAVVKFNAHVLG